MCLCVPNMKFLCLTLCRGWGVCMDDADTNDAGRRHTTDKACLYKALWLLRPNGPKTASLVLSATLPVMINKPIFSLKLSDVDVSFTWCTKAKIYEISLMGI